MVLVAVTLGVDFLVDLVVGDAVFSKVSCLDDLLVGLGVLVGWLGRARVLS